MSFTTKDTPWCTLNLHDQEQGVRAFSRIIISTYQGILKFSRAKFSNIQGDPYGRGKDYVDIKFKIPSQAWVTDQPYS